MRKIIYAINLTLDGCCDHTKLVADQELLEHYTQFLSEIGLLVYGRKTYQIMVPYWPDVAKDESSSKAEKDFANAFGSTNKIVFHNHWTALKETRESFTPTFETKC